MRSLRGVWQSWPRTLRWALAISLAAHLLVILPLGIWLYATPVAMPQAPLSAVLKGPGEVTHPASREAQHHAPLSAGEKAKPVVAKRLVPTLSKKEADRALEKPQAVTPVTTGTAQGDPSVTPNAASRSGVQGGHRIRREMALMPMLCSGIAWRWVWRRAKRVVIRRCHVRVDMRVSAR